MRSTVTWGPSFLVIWLSLLPHKKQSAGWPASHLPFSFHHDEPGLPGGPECAGADTLTLHRADPGPSEFLSNSPQYMPITTRPRQGLPNMYMVSHGTPVNNRSEYAFDSEKELKKKPKTTKIFQFTLFILRETEPVGDISICIAICLSLYRENMYFKKLAHTIVRAGKCKIHRAGWQFR